MKLQEKMNRRVGDKEYRRWYLNLSKDEVAKLEWQKGQELKVKIHGQKLILEPM